MSFSSIIFLLQQQLPVFLPLRRIYMDNTIRAAVNCTAFCLFI